MKTTAEWCDSLRAELTNPGGSGMHAARGMKPERVLDLLDDADELRRWDRAFAAAAPVAAVGDLLARIAELEAACHRLTNERDEIDHDRVKAWKRVAELEAAIESAQTSMKHWHDIADRYEAQRAAIADLVERGTHD